MYFIPKGASAAVCSKAGVLLLLIHCLLMIALFVGVCSWSSFCYAVLGVHSRRLAINSLRMRNKSQAQ